MSMCGCVGVSVRVSECVSLTWLCMCDLLWMCWSVLSELASLAAWPLYVCSARCRSAIRVSNNGCAYAAVACDGLCTRICFALPLRIGDSAIECPCLLVVYDATNVR